MSVEKLKFGRVKNFIDCWNQWKTNFRSNLVEVEITAYLTFKPAIFRKDHGRVSARSRRRQSEKQTIKLLWGPVGRLPSFLTPPWLVNFSAICAVIFCPHVLEELAVYEANSAQGERWFGDNPKLLVQTMAILTLELVHDRLIQWIFTNRFLNN